jgi:hypothetical protein
LAAIGALLSLGTATAADDQPVEIRLTVTDRAWLEQLSRLVSVYDVRDGEVFAVASPQQLERITDAGFRWRAVPKAAVAPADMCPTGWVDDPDRSWDCYPTYAQYVDLMTAFADTHPTVCRLVDLGPSSNQVRPHRLWAVRISDSPDMEEAEPEVLLTSTMHGDEASGFVLLLRLIHELLTGYDSDPEITVLVDSFEIWINPNANPAGTYFVSDDTIDGSIRYYTESSGGNSWVDPNRNFPDPDEGDHPDDNPWWPETQAMIAFAEEHSITLSANLHDGAELVNYPWDTWSRRHVDDALLIHISRGYADLAQADGPPGYMSDQSNGITNGWDWKPIAGGRQDFMTFWHSDREVTIELSHTKTPPASMLEQLWSANRRALLGFIAQAGLGIHGVVTGPGGEPVAATVELVGHDSAADNSSVRTDPDVGDYHRLALPGSYTVGISAVGYEPELFDGVTVLSQGPTMLDLVMQRSPIDVSGTVTTPATLLPITGATVELVGTEHSATTNADSSFLITGVPWGDYTVRVFADDFETVERAVSVPWPAATLDVALPPLSFRRYSVLLPED